MDQNMSCKDLSCPLFQALLDRLRADMSGSLAAPEGSAEEAHEIWARVSAADCLRVKTNKATLSRWFEFMSRYQQFDDEYTCNQFMVNIACKATSVYRRVIDMPVWGLDLCLADLPARIKDAKCKAGKHDARCRRGGA